MSSIAPPRLAWPDLARGVSVLLVVMHHVVRQMVAQSPESWQPAAAVWTLIDEFLTPIRIPLFFFISGLLAARAIGGSFWRDRRAWVVPAYLYLLWSTLLTLRLLLPGAEHDHSFQSNLVGNLVLAGSGYWYLYALPIYFTYAYLTRRLPGWLAALPLVAGLVLREWVATQALAVGQSVMDSASLIGSIAANGVFFWLGARYGKSIVRALSMRHAVVLIAVIFAYSATQIAAMYLGTAEMLVAATAILGIAVGVMVAKRAPMSNRISRGVQYVGQRTLPVYVAQFFFISGFSFVWTHLGGVAIVSSAVAVSWIYPVAITLLITATSLVCYSLAMRTHWLRWLFTPPRALTGVGASSSTRSG